jgi:hypothetical protein
MASAWEPELIPAIQAEIKGAKGIDISSADDLKSQLDGLRLFGLAFSGGGIRSATFNLGVLQGLERIGLLRCIDYLSTVSGGGYIGSWYLSCLKEGLDPHQQLNGEVQDRGAMRHLRKFSRYLAPEAGFFSADTWTIAMVWLRNTVLLQVMLASLFAVLLLLPRFFEYAFLSTDPTLASVAAAALFLISAAQIIFWLWRMDTTTSSKFEDQGPLQVTVVLPVVVGCAFFASAVWNWKVPFDRLLWGAFLLVGAATWCAVRMSILKNLRGTGLWLLESGAIGVLCGALFAGLVYLLNFAYSTLKAHDTYHTYGQWVAGIVGAPALLAALGLAVILQIGLMGRAVDDFRREWWSRLGAFLAIYCVAAAALSLAGLGSARLIDLLFHDFSKWLGGSLTVGGVVTTISGLLAGRSPDTGGNGKSPVKELLAKIAPLVFVAGLLILVSFGLNWAVNHYSGCGAVSHWDHRWDQLTCSINTNPHSDPYSPLAWQTLWAVLGVCLAVLGLLAWRLDINEASMNPFYRNRLVRCFMGAARAAKGLRHPNPFTGFDFRDDFAFAALRSEKGYQGPVPIVNTALNLTGHDNAALEERRAASFFFTPYQSGSKETGTVATEKMGKSGHGIPLGACVAASGAAASPNMGYHTSAPVAFLMTFFNVRLGLWIGSPGIVGTAKMGKQSPRWGLYYLLKELFATADVSDHYLYLSDGGHFENLGVYELIRRRCRYIVAGDAEQDEGLVMEALGGLVRKCRIDFGVEIEIDTSQIRQRDEKGLSQAHCAVGRIIYDARDRSKDGYLVYLKSSLTGDEDSDILQYKAQHDAFPHESTGDQFFDESQVESYRALGEHIVTQAFAGRSGLDCADQNTLKDVMKETKDHWEPPSPFTAARFSHHAEQLSRLWHEIRKDPETASLDSLLFPGWTKGSRSGLYLAQTILQLMENAYLDLNLEAKWEHPDNEGWRVLFTRWAKADVVREAYRVSGDTYGSRFRYFCETHLELPKGNW